MDKFTRLRAKARAIRAVAIASAWDEYSATLATIDARELRSLAKVRRGEFQACVDSVIPRDRQFTIKELLAALMTKHPNRRWVKHSVSRYVCRLRKAGLVRRLTRSCRHVPAIFVWIGVEVLERPFGDKPLPVVAAEVLGSRSMTILELSVAIREAGYATAMSHKTFYDAVGTVLRDGVFKSDGKKWTLTHGLSEQF